MRTAKPATKSALMKSSLRLRKIYKHFGREAQEKT
jgi:hypothetical protein